MLARVERVIGARFPYDVVHARQAGRLVTTTICRPGQHGMDDNEGLLIDAPALEINATDETLSVIDVDAAVHAFHVDVEGAVDYLSAQLLLLAVDENNAGAVA